MAWWWSSPSTAVDPPSDLSTQLPVSKDTSHQDIPPDDSYPIAPNEILDTPPESTRELSRDELAYEELKDLFSRVDSEGSTRAAAVAKVRVAEKSQRATAATNSALYPSTMSCTQAWDQAFYCQSIGGQMNNIYRYGGLRSCSEVWAQWRFCMRMKAVRNEDERATRIQQWYKERAARYKRGPSSEDVWEVRRVEEDREGENNEPDAKDKDRDFHYP